MEFKNILRCPLCHSPLSAEGASLFCGGERRHCYDISSSGYVNLLPPGKRSNAKTGDDKEMLRSRRLFLSAGFYDRISEEAAKAALEYVSVPENGELIFADAGCGDGYHALNIEKAFLSKGISSDPVGLEASKVGAEFGAKLARKENSRAKFLAANIFDMPLTDKSCDIVFSMFAPVPDSEACRVLKDDGALVVCSSGSYHLWEMRQVLYGEPRISPPLDRTPEGFTHVGHSSLSYTVPLESQELIAALFTMTPFYWRCPREGRERLLSLDTLTVRIETEYNVYKKG